MQYRRRKNELGRVPEPGRIAVATSEDDDLLQELDIRTRYFATQRVRDDPEVLARDRVRPEGATHPGAPPCDCGDAKIEE
jgi:hypothetical protein